MAQRRNQGKPGEDGASDADLAQHLGLLDWEALDPLSEAQARAAEGQEGALGFFLGEELLEGDEPGVCCSN